MNNEPLPACRFCQGETEIVEHDIGRIVFYVSCANIECSGCASPLTKYGRRCEAIEAYTRATPKPTADIEERARELANLATWSLNPQATLEMCVNHYQACLSFLLATDTRARAEERERAAGVCIKLRNQYTQDAKTMHECEVQHRTGGAWGAHSCAGAIRNSEPEGEL